MTGSPRHWAALACISAAWLGSLALPAISASGAPTFTGLDLLLRGWQGGSRGVFAWYANPLFIAAVVLAVVHRLRAAGVVSGVATVLALTSFFAEDVLRGSMQSVPPITLRVGFYLWAGAFVALFLWSCAAMYLQDRNHLRGS